MLVGGVRACAVKVGFENWKLVGKYNVQKYSVYSSIIIKLLFPTRNEMTNDLVCGYVVT
jgi:hypothetical protein